MLLEKISFRFIRTCPARRLPFRKPQPRANWEIGSVAIGRSHYLGRNVPKPPAHRHLGLSGSDALVVSDGTSSPTLGPDGDVYFGVLENPLFSNRFRGWLLHYDSTLAQTKTPGGFGWDDTASVVPAKLVPTYSGSSA